MVDAVRTRLCTDIEQDTYATCQLIESDPNRAGSLLGLEAFTKGTSGQLVLDRDASGMTGGGLLEEPSVGIDLASQLVRHGRACPIYLFGVLFLEQEYQLDRDSLCLVAPDLVVLADPDYGSATARMMGWRR